MDHSNYVYHPTQAQLITASQPTVAVEQPIIRNFSDRIAQEFIQGSAIAPSLFQAAVHICQDLETTATGDVETPIHDALNWRYSRFGHRPAIALRMALKCRIG